MNKHWTAVKYNLSLMTKQQRFNYFKYFRTHRPNWSDHLMDALYLVVVDLESQSYAARLFGMHKQEVNRAVKKYKDYLGG
jgi:hypothetical protein